jgi:iron-sulfur cluster assembly protein
MTTEQSHETSADHSCGCGHEHGESHESPKPQEVHVESPQPQEVVVESPQPQTQSGKLITITEKAAEKISEFIKEEKESPQFLRIYVQGGGCSGLSYGMGFEKAAEEDDIVIEENGVKVIVDTYSQEHLQGANVDYIESLMGSGFKINNPNVTKSCSCGSSFSTE